MKTLSALQLRFICLVTGLAYLTSVLTPKRANADIFGADVAVLSQILIQAIDEVYKLQQLVGKTEQTVNILEDMNRGVKEVLRLSQTAHVPLPPGVYAQAKTIAQAALEARQVYGGLGDKSPTYAKTHYQSGTEGLSLSQDAFDYSTFLDDQGEKIKSSAVLANQASATRLTAETLGVVLHAVNHSSRIQAKNLEMTSSSRLEDSAKENAKFQSFVNTQDHIEDTLKDGSINSLNEVAF